MRDYILKRCEIYIYDMTGKNNSNPMVLSLHPFHKKLSSIGALVNVDVKTNTA
jgi:hypothetical protein